MTKKQDWKEKKNKKTKRKKKGTKEKENQLLKDVVQKKMRFLRLYLDLNQFPSFNSH